MLNSVEPSFRPGKPSTSRNRDNTTSMSTHNKHQYRHDPTIATSTTTTTTINMQKMLKPHTHTHIYIIHLSWNNYEYKPHQGRKRFKKTSNSTGKEATSTANKTLFRCVEPQDPGEYGVFQLLKNMMHHDSTLSVLAFFSAFCSTLSAFSTKLACLSQNALAA